MNYLTQKLCLVWVAIALLSTGCEQVTKQLPSRQPPQPSLSPKSATNAQIEAEIRQEINQVRQKNGLQPLKDHQNLAQVARKYSRQMAQKNFFSHTGADGSTPQERVLKDGILYTAVGENLFMSKLPTLYPLRVSVGF
ncbi:CAP domain-containing protein [Anabaena sp. CA = ATCC 33047]|uniref:CAP domain-containing protein n=1 Tax=Anabaena sp. (strain CA / ATCC 33047) TaxID=52271 RepID=UPI000835141A|nr:CAP domain-containing protein [Anabaena sp. CA = ATCC 33047]